MQANSLSRHAVAAAFVAVASLLVTMHPAFAAAEAPERTAEAALDAVTGDVVRLLDAGLGEPLILRWLQENDARPRALGTADLVALKEAGASDELVAALLDRVRASAPAPMATAAAEPAPPASADVRLGVALRYIHSPDEGEPWDLVVYLDGVPFPPQKASSSERNAPTWTGSRTVDPGRHVVRWAQERHGERRGERWLHAARFDSESLVFELAAGAPAELGLEFRDRSGFIKRFGGPVDARVVQAERELAVVHTDNDPLDWPLLCEDVEASIGDRKPGFDDRHALKICVRWAELWPDSPAVPPRDSVRPPAQ